MTSEQEQIFQYFKNRWQIAVQKCEERPEPWVVREFFETHITNFVDQNEIYSAVTRGENKEYEVGAARICADFLIKRPKDRRLRRPTTARVEKEIRSQLEANPRYEIMFRETLESTLRETWNWYLERTKSIKGADRRVP